MDIPLALDFSEVMPRRAGASDSESSGGARVERGDAASDRQRSGVDGRPAPDGVPLRAEWPDPGWSDTEWAEAEWIGSRPGPESRPTPPEGYPDSYDGAPPGSGAQPGA